MQQLLTLSAEKGGFGFYPDNVCMLLDEQASMQNVQSAVQHTLIDQAGNNDFVRIYFAGHGSLVNDVDADEPGEWDQSLLLYNSRDGQADLIDDQFHTRLQALRAKTRKIALIIDAGFSAVRENGNRGYFVNDRLLGEAEPDNALSYLDIEPGPAVIRVQAPDFITSTQRAEIRAGKWTQVVMVLEPEPIMAKLRILSANKPYALALKIGVSSLKNVNNADSGQAIKWLKVPARDPAPNQKKIVTAGGITYEIVIVSVRKTRYRNKLYYALSSLKFEVTPRIKPTLNPAIIRNLRVINSGRIIRP